VSQSAGHTLIQSPVQIDAGRVVLSADLTVPPNALGLILFAHGSGSSRHSSRNRMVAGELQSAGFATLLLDLLSEQEERRDREDARLRFDIALLADRLIAATDWAYRNPVTASMHAGYFGASTGAAAALVAAASRAERIAAIVSRGGRPDLAGTALGEVPAPTLLIVGGRDEPVIPLNEMALDRLAAKTKQLTIIPGATHLFEEPGALEQVARLARDWFDRHLRGGGT
jgi:putative phosphoribosyl transferase